MRVTIPKARVTTSVAIWEHLLRTIAMWRGKQMSGQKSWKERSVASASEARQWRDAGQHQALSLSDLAKVKAARSSDPYNTSGSFDRTKNWARVGKR
jgi:hypothetical protein